MFFIIQVIISILTAIATALGKDGSGVVTTERVPDSFETAPTPLAVYKIFPGGKTP